MTTKILFEELLCESKRFYRWKDKWILATQHSLDQIGKRFKLSKDHLKSLFKKAIDKMLAKGLPAGPYVFYSPELEYGFVGAVKPNQDIVMITFLPKGRSNPKPGTEKIIVEEVEYAVVFI